jgi:hypothetical protein
MFFSKQMENTIGIGKKKVRRHSRMKLKKRAKKGENLSKFE